MPSIFDDDFEKNYGVLQHIKINHIICQKKLLMM